MVITVIIAEIPSAAPINSGFANPNVGKLIYSDIKFPAYNESAIIRKINME